MFSTRKDRGPVLLAVRVRSAKWTLFLWIASIAVICLMVSLALLKPHGWKRAFPGLLFIPLYLSQIHDYLFYPWIKFRQGGAVRIPETERLAVEQLLGAKLALR